MLGYRCWDGEEGAERAVELSRLRAGAGPGAGSRPHRRQEHQQSLEDPQGGVLHLHPERLTQQLLGGPDYNNHNVGKSVICLIQLNSHLEHVAMNVKMVSLQSQCEKNANCYLNLRATHCYNIKLLLP